MAVVVDDHCTLVERGKKRVRCNYCGKEVTGRHRLKKHLAGIREKVLPCDEVPEKVRAQMINDIMRRKKADANTSSKAHCTLVDKKKKRVKCNYCGKEVADSYRLKYHLSGIREKVLPCDEVPEEVKAQMKNEIMRRKKADADGSSNDSCKQKGDLYDSDQPSLSKKRNHCATIESGSKKKDEMAQSLIDPKQLHARDAGKIEKVAEDSSSRQIQRCIGRFFFENGIDFSAANSPYFKKMIRALMGCGSVVYKVPSCDDLKGWILQEELKASQEHVREIVHSWGSTGCSILLDGWTDGKGRDFINFVVDSPRGPIFMKSADVSDTLGDVDAMIALLTGVIEEVGVQNVVQIVSYTTLGSVDIAGKKLTGKYRTISWTVCASHCIGLILDRIGMLDPWRGVLGKAKDITKFICSHETVLKLTRKHTFGLDIVSSRRIKSLTPFLMLEGIESQKKNLKNMFCSLEWKSSNLASTPDGMHVADLVTGESFWTEAQMLLKGSIPLIRAMHLISGGDGKPQLGYIYETMKQVKEQIKEEYKDKETKYQPFWTVIDGIWNNQLHKPIHSSAYILNPSLFYCVDFDDDAEIKDGLSHCIEQMVEDKRARYLTLLQLDDYMQTRGTFGDGDAIDQRMTISPEKWWSLYGGQCPELQNFAIRILSQTCTGALRYGLKRSLSEQLHMNGRNCVDQNRLNDLAFVHHNLRLQNAVSISKTDYRDIFLEEMDHPMVEWVGGGDVKESVSE